MIRVSQVMVRNVLTCPEEQPLVGVAKLMQRHRVGSVVVVRSEHPVGLITERDIVEAVAEGATLADLSASAVMSAPVIVGPEQMDLGEAVKLMVLHNIKRLVLVEGERLVGIVTLTDFARYGPLLNDALRKALDDISGSGQGRFRRLLAAEEPPAEMYG